MKNISIFYFAFRIWLRILFGGLISLILSCSVMILLNNPAGRVLCQVLNYSAAFSLVYLLTWQIGSSDYNRVKQAISKNRPWKGLQAGALACVPWMVPSVILMFAKESLTGWNFLYLFRLLNPVFMPLYYSIFPPTLLISEVSFWRIACSLLLPLIFALIAQFGYYFGYKDITILYTERRAD